MAGIEIGFGTKLQFTTSSTGGTSDFRDALNVRDIAGPTAESDEVECTNFSSTNNYREFLVGMIDPGEITFNVCWETEPLSEGSAGAWFDTATSLIWPHEQITTLFENRTNTSWRIVLPTTTKIISFNGRVRAFQPNIPVDDVITADVTVRLSGAITWPTSPTT
jgi:hypothetical protein